MFGVGVKEDPEGLVSSRAYDEAKASEETPIPTEEAQQAIEQARP